MLKTGSNEMRIMCSFLHLDRDVFFGDRHLSGGNDQVTKDMLRFGGLIALCHLGSQNNR